MAVIVFFLTIDWIDQTNNSRLIMSLEHTNNEDKKIESNQHRFFQFISNENLDLSRQGLTDKDMPELIQFLLQHPKIKVLDLSLNNIGDEGIAYFVERNQYVIQINFSGNNISDLGIAIFAYKNEVVEQVNFSQNLITDQGITNFAQINQICQSSHFSSIQLH